MKVNAKFDIIMPTWDRVDIVKRSIDSVLSQTHKEFCLTVIDDASEDNTQEIVEGLQDKRIRYIRLEKHKGASACRNIGIESSDSELIMYLDSDDIIYKDCLSIFAESYEEQKWNVAYCGVDLTKDEGKTRRVWHNFPFNKSKLLACNYIPNLAFTHRRSLIKEIRWDETLKRLQDWDFWCKLVKVTDFFHINKFLGLVYQNSHNSISKMDSNNNWYKEAYKKIREGVNEV